APLSPGMLVHERYRILSVVGQGGLGTVYQVVDVIYGRQNVYALKELIDQSPGARKQFELESRWLEALDHNHIPKVRESFGWSNRVYLVMDFVDGDNLEQIFSRNGGRPLPEREVLLWMLPICDALQYLHTRMPPILHRDVKPSNIIVTPAGHPVLVDFGIAKEHQPGANRTATFVRKAGTEGYAPPEQYSAGGPTGPWSDVYGLGATLYQLLTGRIPPTAVERVALDAPMPHPRALNPTLSPITDAVIWRALAIRPGDRYQSVLEFAQAIMPAVPELGPGAGAPGAWYTNGPGERSAPATPGVMGSLGASGIVSGVGLAGPTAWPPAPQSMPPQSMPPLQRPPFSSRLSGPASPTSAYGPMSGSLADGTGSGAPGMVGASGVAGPAGPTAAMTRPVLPGPQGPRTPALSPMPLSSPTLAPRPASGSRVGGHPSGPPSGKPASASLASANGAASTPALDTAPKTPPMVEPVQAKAWRGKARRRVAWGLGLLALLLVSIVVSVMVVRAFAPPDRSTPQATVTGYFNALIAQNDNLAW
ncbi:MAG TPA: protein kinase, partial [Chloroflexota bacterium]|nr:protein kinase [Chloroflexota bacterium]